MSIYLKLADIQAQLDDVTTRGLTTGGSLQLTNYLSASQITASNSVITNLTASNADINGGRANFTEFTASNFNIGGGLQIYNSASAVVCTRDLVIDANDGANLKFAQGAYIAGDNTHAHLSHIRLVNKSSPFSSDMEGALTTGVLAVITGSLYFYSGSAWRKVTLT